MATCVVCGQTPRDVDGEGRCMVCQPCEECGSVDCEESLLGFACPNPKPRLSDPA